MAEVRDARSGFTGEQTGAMMIDRRRFVRTIGAVAGGAAAGIFPVTLQAEEKKKHLERIGLQLYTVRDDMKRDFEGTLRKVSEIGYKQVEFAGYFDRSPSDVRAILDRYHLDAPSAHIGTPDALSKDFDKTIENARIMGHKYLIVAYIEEKNRLPLDNYRRYADLFNHAGEQARKAGLRFGYHNHDFEFKPIDGQLPYDLLLQRTDPKLVTMEMDLFWVTKGGKNPLDYFARYPGRFEAVHVKDKDASPEGHMVDVGKGKIDFARIFAQQKKAGIRYFFVEHDNPAPSAIGSVTASYNYLKNLKF
jgi:sugar phosphate isomerase/epimerase